MYTLKVACRLPCALEAYTEGIINVTAVETEAEVDNLLPGSHCDINFRAMYNPASLDPGVDITASTESESKYIHWMYNNFLPIFVPIMMSIIIMVWSYQT